MTHDTHKHKKKCFLRPESQPHWSNDIKDKPDCTLPRSNDIIYNAGGNTHNEQLSIDYPDKYQIIVWYYLLNYAKT